MTSRIVCQNLALLIWVIQCYHLKELVTRISKPKKNLKYLYPLKRYQVYKYEFSAILLLKIAKTHFLKPHIF